MGKLLNRENQKIAGKLGVEAVEHRTNAFLSSDSEVFDAYEKMCEEKKILNIQFSMCDREGTFSARDDAGIIIVMAASDTVDALPYFNPYIASVLVGYKYDVYVTKVDREAKRVYVKSARNGRYATKKNCIREIMNELELKHKPVVWGKITSVREDRAYVDLLGQGILGIVDVRHWKRSHTRRLDVVCKAGEFYEFEITHACAKRPGRDQVFLLERRNLAENPWTLIPRDIVKKGAILRVECVEIPDGKTYWWGTTTIAPGIEVMCDFPRDGIRIFPGITYKCRVKELTVSEEDSRENRFRVACVAVSDEDSESYAKCIQFLNERIDEEIADSMEQDAEEEVAKSQTEGSLSGTDDSEIRGAES